MSDQRRSKLAQLSFTEKIKLLEKLRARSLAFAKAREQILSSKNQIEPIRPEQTGTKLKN